MQFNRNETKKTQKKIDKFIINFSIEGVKKREADEKEKEKTNINIPRGKREI